ncbi:biotin/lipoyl-containing protein [Chloroflexota bacterium]
MAKEAITIPMSGKIISVEVKVGDTVNEDDVVCMLESMKMENPIVSPVSGKVVEISAKAGDSVSAGQTVAVIETA